MGLPKVSSSVALKALEVVVGKLRCRHPWALVVLDLDSGAHQDSRELSRCSQGVKVRLDVRADPSAPGA